MIRDKRLLLSILLAAIVTVLSGVNSAAAEAGLSKGQYVYVPAYSHIYSGDNESPMLLTVTLSIRNTDMKHSMKLLSVDYYNTKGKLIRKYLKKPMALKALEATRFVVKHSDSSGGSGASFIVRWVSEKPVNMPIMESVMIGTQFQQGISFTSRGYAIKKN